MNLTGKRVVVMGLGRFGGGAGVARFCVEKGAKVLITDVDPADKLAAGLAMIQGLPVELRLGEHRIEDFTSADLVVVNPAVKPDNLYVAAARDAGVALTSEIRLLVQHLPDRAKTIGITGSAGKSTTTAMTGHAMAKALGESSVHVGGNIGGSLLSQLDQIKPDHWVILELSSFMLQGLRDDGWSPHIAVVTNLNPNHLDWHGSIDHYRAAKQAIYDFQRDETGDIAIGGPEVLNDFTPRVKDYRPVAAKASWPANLLVPGDHNRLNARMASEIVHAAIGQSHEATCEALADFPGLPHRLQFVCEASDVRYYNDSKATTPEAAILAIQSFAPHIVHVILGGYDKKTDLTPMAEIAASRCHAIYTIGVTGPAIARAAANSHAHVFEYGTLDAAVAKIVTQVRRGDVVLLSTGCASWDQFENYEQRGQKFAEAVLKYTGEGAPIPPLR